MSEAETSEIVETFEELLHVVRRRAAQDKPNQRFRDSVKLRETTRSVLWAEIVEIINEHTGELHHDSLKISRTKKTSLKLGNKIYTSDTEVESVWINNNGNREVDRLTDFLNARSQIPGEPGRYLIVPVAGQPSDVKGLQELVRQLASGEKARLLTEVLKTVGHDPDLLNQLHEIATSSPDAAKVAAASLNLARYSEAIEQLEALIEDNAQEQAFQVLLEENPWMFGGEYSTREPRRRWTRDENADFMMRRTVDDYLELIEIKRPIHTKLFQEDPSHDSLYPSRDLSKVVGQVIGYLDEIDASRDNIERRDEVNVNKLRAKIIIGLDHDQEQVDALRMYNSHLHRIEVLTFDQLVRTAKRVRDHLEAILDPVISTGDDDLGDVPF